MLFQFLSETGGWGEKRGTSKSSEGGKIFGWEREGKSRTWRENGECIIRQLNVENHK